MKENLQFIKPNSKEPLKPLDIFARANLSTKHINEAKPLSKHPKNYVKSL